MVEIIGVPFDLCGKIAGSSLGPAALRYSGLLKVLKEQGEEVVADLDLSWEPIDAELEGAKRMQAFERVYDQISETVTRVLERGNRPILLGGDHSISLASVGAALRHTQGDMSLLWIDAHADLHSMSSSDSGNLHGMPIGGLIHRPQDKETPLTANWEAMVRRYAPVPLEHDRVSWIGLRAVDPEEDEMLLQMPGCFPTTMQDIDQYGIGRVIGAWETWMQKRPSRKLWISFDVDVLDPILAPGTGTTVRGGLTYREGHFLAEKLHHIIESAQLELVGLDVVEVNPTIDRNNETALVAVEWLASLFGKRILSQPHKEFF